MKKALTLALTTMFYTVLSAQTGRGWTVELYNDLNKELADAPIVINLHQLKPGFRVRSAVVMDGQKEIPSQLDDLNGDLKADELAFVIPISAKSKKTLDITLSSETDRKSVV